MIKDYSRYPVTPMRLYERNYKKLFTLFPNMIDFDQLMAKLPYHVLNDEGSLRLKIEEHFRYTSIVTLYRDLPLNSISNTVEMNLRLSHDASVAEVIAFQGSGKIQKFHHYPNSKMYHIDEKKQLNMHLKHILDMAIQQNKNRCVTKI